ncbi:MAG: DNA mismatch repair protein MutS [Erysipelotrichaceae bacterium]|nr:DNA mismatch repair protein MutS [Erysipelotrichaceae bacterium]
MAEYTPMMQQYLEVKKKYQDTLVFYRLGDFYELFFDDAKTASHELDLVLTGRNAGVEEKVPMCGVPHHAVSSYIQRLINKGYKVAVVEQLEDPATATGIVKRDVIRVVTPGTIMDETLDEKISIYIAALHDYQYGYALTLCEMATGETKAYFVEKDFTALNQFLKAKGVRELVVHHEFADSVQATQLQKNSGITVSVCDEDTLKPEYEYLRKNVSDARIICSLGRLIQYLEATQKRMMQHLQVLTIADEHESLYMDYSTKQNLELIEPLRTSSKNETLWSFMDHCRSSMGSRLLKKWVEYPLIDVHKIQQRLDMIDYLNRNFMAKSDLKEALSKLYDLDRLITRIAYGSANAKDCLRLEQTLTQAPIILDIMNDSCLFSLFEEVKPCNEVLSLIKGVFVENPPVSIKEGGMFVDGYHPTLDEYRDIQRNGKQWIAQLENKERERTQIKNLKIGYNRVFGYYIEISKGNIGLVQDEWGYIRKQTLTNAERFITSELKEREDEILHAEERTIRLETELFLNLMNQIKQYIPDLQQLSFALASADALYSLACVSEKSGYVKPTFNTEHELRIKEGRHPIIESIYKDTRYIPNDVIMPKDRNVLIITGPNMGGKSTYMRQTVLIIIMAQIGCYVPAEKAELPIFDKVFTRIGASDDILSGQSTFMVEMSEANQALKHATEHSFILFDEIGRGTSTYDGMALAQSMLEYITTCIGAKTMFSTHYHELTQMEDTLPDVHNVHVEVFEEDDHVTFLYKIKDGRADRSYGINVARLAKLPETVLDRAKTLLDTFEQSKNKKKQVQSQMLMMERIPTGLEQIKENLSAIDPNRLTPLEALQLVVDLKALVDKKD